MTKHEECLDSSKRTSMKKTLVAPAVVSMGGAIAHPSEPPIAMIKVISGSLTCEPMHSEQSQSDNNGHCVVHGCRNKKHVVRYCNSHRPAQV